MRLHKILAQAGVASRRAAERMMAEGRVRVNGQVATAPGTLADPAQDTITVDGRPLPRVERPVYIALNKPPGVVTTAHDPQGRPTVLDLVNRPERLFPVGRLDRDTEGLLLLTNDGAWANVVAHPSSGVEKEYVATVDGVPTLESLQRLTDGVALPDGHVAHGAAHVLERLDGKTLVSLTLHEGHKRQARLMFGALGYPVRRLIRVRVGGLRLQELAPGAWRVLSPAEVRAVTRHEERSARPGDEEGRAREWGGKRRGPGGEAGRAGRSPTDRLAGHRD